MKKSAIVALIIVSIAYLFLKAYGYYLNSQAATVTLIRREGYNIIERLETARISKNISLVDGFESFNFTNSTDLINTLIKPTEITERSHLLRYSCRASKYLKKNGILKSSDNVWTIINRTPTNAPDNLIVLATRNIDPRSFRICLTDKMMDQRVVFLPEDDKGVLKHVGLVFRKDGTTRVIPRTTRFSKATTYREIYENQSFDLSVNQSGGSRIEYLTPYDKVSP